MTKAAKDYLDGFGGLYVHPRDQAMNAVGQLFQEISARHGLDTARRVFALWGAPPSASRLKAIKKMRIVDRLDLMPGGPNKDKLAREIAEETRVNPTADDVDNIGRTIDRADAERRKNPYFPQRIDDTGEG